MTAGQDTFSWRVYLRFSAGNLIRYGIGLAKLLPRSFWQANALWFVQSIATHVRNVPGLSSHPHLISINNGNGGPQLILPQNSQFCGFNLQVKLQRNNLTSSLEGSAQIWSDKIMGLFAVWPAGDLWGGKGGDRSYKRIIRNICRWVLKTWRGSKNLQTYLSFEQLSDDFLLVQRNPQVD